MRRRWQANLQALKEELLRRMPMPVREQGGGRYCALAAEVATCRGMRATFARWFPLVRVCHPYPLVRWAFYPQVGGRDAVTPLVRIWGGVCERP